MLGWKPVTGEPVMRVRVSLMYFSDGTYRVTDQHTVGEVRRAFYPRGSETRYKTSSRPQVGRGVRLGESRPLVKEMRAFHLLKEKSMIIKAIIALAVLAFIAVGIIAFIPTLMP